MTSKRQAALAYEMQSRGIDYGQTIARLAIEQFPDGFDDEAGEGMQKIVQTAVTSALDKLAAGGVRKSLREAHEGGFYAGARYLYRLCRRLPCSCRAECGSRLKRLSEDLPSPPPIPALISKPPRSTCRRKQHPCDSNRHERKAGLVC